MRTLMRLLRCLIGFHLPEVVMERSPARDVVRFSLYCRECGAFLPADHYWREEMFAQARREAARAGYPQSMVLRMVPEGRLEAQTQSEASR